MLHDRAPTHNGKMRPKKAAFDTYLHFDGAGAPMELNAWLKSRRVAEGGVPPGWTSRRPKDQRVFNFLVLSKYDNVLAEFCGKADFRGANNDTPAHVVLAALAITDR